MQALHTIIVGELSSANEQYVNYTNYSNPESVKLIGFLCRHHDNAGLNIKQKRSALL